MANPSNATNVTTTTPVPALNELGFCGMLGTKFGYSEREVWFQMFWSYGIPFIITFSLSWFVLWKYLGFRLDRVDALLLGKGWCWTKRKSPGETDAARGRRVYWVTKLVQLALVFPMVLLVVWGVAVTNAIPKAPMMGASMLTLWLGCFLGAYGFFLWKRNGWSLVIRDSKVFLTALFAVSITLILLFELLAVLLESAGVEEFSFTGISWAYMTLNMIPMVTLAHVNDPNLKLVANEWKQRGRVFVGGQHGPLNVPGNPDPARSVQGNRANLVLYGAAVATLLLYVVTFALGGERVTADMSMVAAAVSCAVLVLDGVLFLLWKGQHVVNPIAIFFIMILGRACLISFGHTYWFIGQSTMFLIFGSVISKSIVDNFMKAKADKKDIALKKAAAEAEQQGAQEGEAPGLMKGISLAGDEGGEQQPGTLEKLSQPVVILGIISVAFVVLLLVVCFVINQSNMKTVTLLEKPHDQWEFGIASIYLVIVYISFYFTIRNSRVEALMDETDNKELSLGTQTLTFMAMFYLFTVGGGFVLFWITKTHEIVWTAVCLPVIVGSFIVWNVKYRASDYTALGPRSKRKTDGSVPLPGNAEDTPEFWDDKFKLGACDGWSSGVALYQAETGCGSIMGNWKRGDFRRTNACCAYIRCGLPKADYEMVFLLQMFVVFNILWGVGILSGETSTDPYIRGIGPTLTFVTFLLAATVIPILEWFNRLAISSFMTAMFVVAGSMHVGFHLYVWRMMQSGEITRGSLATLLSFVMYPAIVFFVVALYKWRDDGNKLSPFVTGCLIGSQASILIFEGVVALSYDVIVGVILFVLHAVVLFLLASFAMWVKNKYYLPKAHRLAIVIVFAVVVVVGTLTGLFGEGLDAFYAFSASWFTLSFFLGGSATIILYPALREGRVLFTETVFPVFVWDPASNKLKVAYVGVALAYLSLFTILLWGVVATIFICPVYLGMGFASISICCIFCMTLSLSFLSRRHFAQAILSIRRQDAFEKIMNGGEGASAKSLDYILSQAERKALRQVESGAQKKEVESEVLETGDLEGGSSQDSRVQRSDTIDENGKLPSAFQYRQDVTEIERALGIFYSRRFSCSATVGAVTTAAEPGSGATEEAVTIDALASQLLSADKMLSRTFYADQSVSSLYRALVQLSATSRLQQSDAVFSSFLSWCRKAAVQPLLIECDLGKYFGADAQKRQMQGSKKQVTLAMAFGWATRKKTAFRSFQQLLKTFQKEKEKEVAEQKRKEALEREAERKRQEARRAAEEERKRKEAERWAADNAEAARRMEEARKKKEEEIRRRAEIERKRAEEEERRLQEEEERRIAEAGLADAEQKRLAEERRRAAEEERRRRKEEERNLREARDAAERERKRKEMEAARKKREEERRRKERERIAALSGDTGGGGGSGGQTPGEIARAKKRAEIERRRKAREEKRKKRDQNRTVETRKEIERTQQELIAAQAAESLGTNLTEEQLLKRDFEIVDGKYVDKAWKNPKAACRINVNRPPEDRIEAPNMVWARPEQFMTNPQLVVIDEEDADTEGFGFNDIKQGQLGDCWLLAAMTVVACHPEYMKKVMDIEGNRERAKKGYYAINIYSDGRYSKVLVDSTILCTKTNNRSKPFSPMFVHSRSDNELWPMILEKAYARHNGSFEAINGGFVHVGLVDFTGGFGSAIDLQESQVDINSGALFKRLLEYKANGFLMGAGSPSGSDTDTSETGIVQGHAYAVLDIVQERDSNGAHQLICLRNPWGEQEWTGDWSDKDRIHWTSRMKKRLHFSKKDDGKFWMSFVNFTQNFSRVYLCKTFKLQKDGGSFYYCSNTGKWLISDKSAGGCPSKKNPNCDKNPHFLIKPSRPCTVYISVEQHSIGGHMPTDHHQNFYVLKKNGKRCKGMYRGDKIGGPGTYINSQMVTAEVKLEPYEPGYTLFCSTYRPNCEAQINVRVYSDAPLLNVDYTKDEPILPALGKNVPVDDGMR